MASHGSRESGSGRGRPRSPASQSRAQQHQLDNDKLIASLGARMFDASLIQTIPTPYKPFWKHAGKHEPMGGPAFEGTSDYSPAPQGSWKLLSLAADYDWIVDPVRATRAQQAQLAQQQATEEPLPPPPPVPLQQTRCVSGHACEGGGMLGNAAAVHALACSESTGCACATTHVHASMHARACSTPAHARTHACPHTRPPARAASWRARASCWSSCSSR